MRPGTLARGEHACAIYRSDEEHWELTADFLAAGLTGGERVVCIDDEGTADAVLRRLRDDGLDPRPHVATGQLLVEPAQLPPRGAGIAPHDIAAAIRAQLDEALTMGYPGFRMAFETGSVLRDTGDVDWLLDIDAACMPMYHTRPLAALCQIDERLTSSAQRAKIRRRHGWEVVVPARHDDGLLRITDDGPGRCRLAGEIDVSNHAVLRTELAHSLALGGDVVRVGVASLRFAGAAAVGVFVEAVNGLSAGRKIVLERPPPFLERVLRSCRLDQLPGLTIETYPAEVVK